MTSDQVLVDEAAPVASEAKPKPVRRRTTKKTEAAAPAPAEHPTLPEMSSASAPEAVAPSDAVASPEPPKRTRTRVAKPKTSEVEAAVTGASPPEAQATPEVEAAPKKKVVSRKKTTSAAAAIEGTKTPTSVEAQAPVATAPPVVVETPSAPVVTEAPVAAVPVATETAAPEAVEARTAPETAVETAPVAQTPVSSPPQETEAAPATPESSQNQTPTRPSVPARFPSRFKRVTAPQPESQPQAQAEATPAPVAEVASPTPPVTAAPSLVSEAAIETREDMESRASETVAPGATPEAQSEPQSGNSDAPPQGYAQQQNPDGDNQNAQQGGEFGGQNGEGEGGFGRMRYRERREFRRQQRMQQRQERFGPNGEVLPPLPNQPQQTNQNPNQNGQNGFVQRGNNGQNGYVPQPRRRDYDYFSLRALSPEELENAAQEYNVDTTVERDHQELVMAVMESQARTQNSVLKTGILDAHDHNKAFLRCEGYTPSENDVYVSQTQIKRFNLKTGDLVFGTARAPKENERFFGLLRVESINGLSPEELRTRKDFEKLTPIFPDDRYHLETEQGNITARIIDLVTPVGKGQRGLIVAPPKAGKTTLLKNIANSITKNNPEAELFVLLIDERPEEVTDISRSVRGEVVASTFDEMPENHMRVADIVLERAKRLVEMKHDVVILLDSITRLSRASNLVVTPSGRTLSGGLDPAAMYRPKRMFGAARNIEEGGSLTILATALVDTGSRMDEMIFEEFKGTGNMDLVLDRDLFNQRIFPAIDINKSGTRRDDLLLSKDELAATFHLRQTLARLDNDQAVKLMIDRLKNTKSNGDFMAVVAKSARQAEIKAAQ